MQLINIKLRNRLRNKTLNDLLMIYFNAPENLELKYLRHNFTFKKWIKKI